MDWGDLQLNAHMGVTDYVVIAGRTMTTPVLI